MEIKKLKVNMNAIAERKNGCLKKVLAAAGMIGILTGIAACGLNDENVTHIQKPGMTGNSVSDDSRDEKTTTYESGVTGVNTTYTTTVTTGRGFKGSDINPGERKSIGTTSKKDDTNSSSKDDNTMSSNLKPSSDSNSSDSNDLNTGNDKDSNKDKTGRGGHSIAGNGGSGSGNGGSGSGNGGSGSKGNGTGNYTTPAVTTSTTSKPTTESTTSTTEATTIETEPETEPQTEPITPGEFVLDQIGNRKTVWAHFSSMMNRDLKANSGVDRGFYEVDFGYGYTDMYNECIFALNSLNKPYYNNDNIISGLYKFSTADDLVNYKQFLYSFKYVQDYLNSDIDYSKYIIDGNVSYLLQGVDDASRNGYLDDFMVNNIDSINLLIQDYPGLGAIVFSYENGKYLNFDAIDNSMNDFINHICEVTYGYGYSK